LSNTPRSGPILGRRRTERRKAAEKKRREGMKSNCSSRTKRVLGNIIDLQAARSRADMTLVEARSLVIDEVIARINPLKKSKAAQSEDSSGHLRTSKSISPEKLYHGMARYRRQDNACIHLKKHCFSSKNSVNTTAKIRTRKNMLMLSVYVCETGACFWDTEMCSSLDRLLVGIA
jgi:hypothetical protein